jgi:N6-adenosine-specific RNA methylase IME4
MSKKYDVILADAPWRYSNSKVNGAAEKHYPTLSTKELCSLGKKVRELSKDDSILFFWTTTPMVPDALQVIEAWGYKYKTSLAWLKVQDQNISNLNEMIPSYGTGFWVRGCFELIMIATKGKIERSPEASAQLALISNRFKHSRKPDNIHEMAEKYFPKGNYLELFARRSAPGWDVIGNEIDGTNLLEM